MTALVTVAEVKNYLTISSNTTDTSDANIAILANYASSAIETFCGREFAAANVSEIHDGGKSSIFVDRVPINSINVVSEYDGVQYVPLVGSTSGEELANTAANANAVAEFVWNSDTGQISRDTGAGSGYPAAGLTEPYPFKNYRRGVKITYNGGYATIPNDIKMATLDYIKLLYKKEQGSSSFSLHGENKEAKPLTSSKFPAHVERILNLYRII